MRFSTVCCACPKCRTNLPNSGHMYPTDYVLTMTLSLEKSVEIIGNKDAEVDVCTLLNHRMCSAKRCAYLRLPMINI